MKFTTQELERLEDLVRSNNVRLAELNIDTLAPDNFKEWEALHAKIKAELTRQNAEPAEIPTVETFGPKLKECRLAAGLSQKQLAEKIGRTQVDVNRWEGGRCPNALMLKRMSLALGCTMDDLV